MLKTFVITSDRGVYRALCDQFHRSLDCYHHQTPVLAIDGMREQQPHIVLVDIDSIPVDPRKFLPRIILAAKAAPVVVLLRSFLLGLVVEMIRYGAADCLLLPPEDSREAVRRLVGLSARRFAVQENSRRRNSEAFSSMLGESLAMRRLQDLIVRVAVSDATVTIEGETGSGKELVAQAIHRLSDRKKGPFVTRNCAAFPDELVEAELFGVAKGAFTGAVQRRGSFEEAGHGTLFLDEISELAPRAQSKLLRVTEDGQVRRVGDGTKRSVDVRLVVATNRPLRDQTSEGLFRKDLLYRLNTLKVTVPPLRERREDIGVIARTFLYKMSGGAQLFSEGSLHLLESYDWPGNVRELLNVVQRARVLSDEPVITPEAIRVEE